LKRALINRCFLTLHRTILLALIMFPPGTPAWGPEGHAAVGVLALQGTNARARAELEALLGSTAPKRLDELCNWPDVIRDQPEWDWAAVHHYVNLPREAATYDAGRDCPEGLCLTEAIKKYALELMDEGLPAEMRTQAFAWLCHLVADLHQPLHCGFAEDRGGNDVDVVFNGEVINLHWFWDSTLIQREAGSRDGLIEALRHEPTGPAGVDWSPSEVNAWTEESRALAGTVAYPPTETIDERFAADSWTLIQQQLPLAGRRLARILNASVGGGEVRPQ
jgi:hypothetical protein